MGENLLKMHSTVCPETTVHAIPNYSTLGCIPNEGECLELESLPDSQLLLEELMDSVAKTAGMQLPPSESRQPSELALVTHTLVTSTLT